MIAYLPCYEHVPAGIHLHIRAGSLNVTPLSDRQLDQMLFSLARELFKQEQGVMHKRLINNEPVVLLRGSKLQTTNTHPLAELFADSSEELFDAGTMMTLDSEIHVINEDPALKVDIRHRDSSLVILDQQRPRNNNERTPQLLLSA